MIHMPEVLTIMFSAGNFGRAYDESPADFLGSMGYPTFGHLIHLIIQRVCYRRTGEAHPPHRSFGGCLNSFRWVSRKMDGTDYSFFAMKMMEVPTVLDEPMCLLRRDLFSSFVLVHFGHGSFDVRT